MLSEMRARSCAHMAWASIAVVFAADAAAANKAPKISGSPSQSVVAGKSYNFRPAVSDPEGKALGFSIKNRPYWASFNTATGQLSGNPASNNVGAYYSIQISVSDGTTKVSLPKFGITVKAANSAASSSTPTISGSTPTSVK